MQELNKILSARRLVLIAIVVFHTSYSQALDWRPHYHYVTPGNWMNEPNGLIKIGTTWHLFYQTNPFGITFDNLSWGHATSSDLVNWTYQDIAIPIGANLFSYSGTTWYDVNNDTGLGTAVNPPYLAYFTGFNTSNGNQDQRLAYSLDQGVSWTKYNNNPVISVAQESITDSTNGKESRDPKVFFDAPRNRWFMWITHGGQKKASSWVSTDGKNWIYLTDFSSTQIPGLPASVGAWEVPDFFEIPIEDEVGSKWVMLFTPSSGSPAGGNGVVGILGSFNGSVFTADPVTSSTLWLDYGRDFDGVTSWENVPVSDGRRIIAGVMNSYGGSTPTSTYKSIVSIPRELKLKRLNGTLRLTQQPVAEVAAAGTVLETLSNQTLVPGSAALQNVLGSGLDFELEFTPSAGSELVLEVRKAGSQKTVIRYTESSDEISVDRNNSNAASFGCAPACEGVHTASIEDLGTGSVKLRVLVDESSVEVFGGEGEAVISNLIFPSESSDSVSLYALNGNVVIDSLVVRGLSPDAALAKDGVHYWRMEEWSGDTLYVNGAPTTHGIVDAANTAGQGSITGFSNDPNPAHDPLYVWGPMENLTTSLFSTDVPPAGMFAEGFGSTASLDLNVAMNDGGLAFYPQDQFGAEWVGDGNGAWTQELWFKSAVSSGSAGTQQLIRRENIAAPTADLAIDQATGYLTLATNDAGVLKNMQIANDYLDQQWHYVVARSDGQGVVELFVRSEDGSSEMISAAYTPQINNANVIIGRYEGEINRFNGFIDEVRLVNRRLEDSALQVAQNIVSVPTGPWHFIIILMIAISSIAMRASLGRKSN